MSGGAQAPGAGAGPLAALETAASYLLAPPNLITKEQLKEAEAIFLDFRKIRAPYQLCKEILESSSNEYVLFEAAGLLNTALVNEWSTLRPDDIQLLKNYLLQYIAHRRLPSSVREKLVKVLSVIVKWQSIEDGGASRQALVQEAKGLIRAGAGTSALGCSLLSGILQEHALNARSDPLPADKRQQIKRQFEITDLFDISSFAIQLLQEIVEKRENANHDDIVLAEKLLHLVKSALCWGQVTLMLPALLFDSDRKDHSEAWTALITNEKFFNTLSVMGSHGEPLLSPVLSCLEQLTYVIAGCSEIDKENALRLARALLPLLGVAPSPAPATALRRLVVNFTRHLLSLPPQDLLQFLTTLLAYIEHLIRLSALEEAHAATGTDEEDGWRIGLEAALEAWVELLHVAAPQLSTSRPRKPVPPPFIEGSAHIFDALFKTRLAPPDGTRHAGAENEAEIEEEGSDIDRYDNLLSLAGALGRAAPDHTLPLLARVLEARTNRMQELFLIHGIGSSEVCCIYEDLHWTILFISHVLTQDAEGEVPAMPGELVRYSNRSTGDLNASLRLLATPETPPQASDLESADHIIRLIAGVWRMCWIAGWGAGRWMASPTLGSSVTWFLRRWTRAYWLPDMECAIVSGKPGPVLQAAWGRGNPADIWAAQRLASGALSLLRSLPGDPAPSHHAVQLLKTVASINCQEGFSGIVHIWEAVKWGIGSEGISLSEEVRRGLAATAGAAIASLPESEQSTHLGSLLAPAYAALTSSNTNAFLQAIDIYTGLAEGSQAKSANCIWEKLEPAFVASIQRLKEGEAITRNTLRLAAASVAHLPQNVLNQSDGILLKRIIELIHAYAARPILQFNNAAHAADAEDDYCEETYLIMEIVSELVSNGYDDTMEKGNKEGMAALLAGLNVILPRMIPPTPLLQRPNIAKRYYRLLFDFGPDIICSLDDNLFNIVMRSIADGLEAPSDDDAILVCKLLGNLGGQAHLNKIGGARLLEALPTLANRLLTAAATGTLQSHLGLSASTYHGLAYSLPHMQLPPDLENVMKTENIAPGQQKAAFAKFFSHLNTYNILMSSIPIIHNYVEEE